MGTLEYTSWRNNILEQLQNRNKNETQSFEELVTQHNKLFDNSNSLKHKNLQLSVENEKLRTESCNVGSGATTTELKLQERIHYLEQKQLTQIEELAELHKRKGENSQQIIDLNVKVQEKDKIIFQKDETIQECRDKIAELEREVHRLTQVNKELSYSIQTLKDEHSTLHLDFNCLEEKLRKVQDENAQLVERLIKYKAKDAERMNEENDNFLKKRNLKVQKEIEEACKDIRGLTPESLQEGYGPLAQSLLPNKATIKLVSISHSVIEMDAHDGEVNAVKWSPADRILATGGADRKVKLWDISKDTCENRGILVGSNAGVMAVDFDPSGTHILGASNDYATRVWTVGDQRLRHTLTGHSNKVMAAKFLGESSKVVTGSHDRTLKIWDLRSKACVETKFAGSSCNDLVTVDSNGSIIISGHFDKTIRFWDSRTQSSANNVVVNGKVTSLDLTRDAKYLVCCVRDDTLKLLDLRMNQVINSFSCDGFKVGCDWARATFSPDGQYVAVGSADGSVYVWGVATSKVERVLKEHGSAVTATHWHPYGAYLASVDRSRKAVIWGDV